MAKNLLEKIATFHLGRHNKYCQVEDCTKKYYARGYCCSHYSKFVRKKYGTKQATIYSRTSRNRKKDLVYNAYGGYKCNRCGIEDKRCLSLDHINGNGAEHRKLGIQGASLYRWIVKNNFPKEFQILCMNCQWIKRYENNEG